MQIPDSEWEEVRGSVLRMLAGSSSRSSKPAIFGAAPAPDDGGPRRPLGSAREGDAVALEVAAAEMAQAAAALVAIERTIMSATEKGVSPCCFVCPMSNHGTVRWGKELEADLLWWVLLDRTLVLISCVWKLSDSPGLMRSSCTWTCHSGMLCRLTPQRWQPRRQSAPRRPRSWSGAWLPWRPCWLPGGRRSQRPSLRLPAGLAQICASRRALLGTQYM